jgi:ParB family chromosome partitioning protein
MTNLPLKKIKIPKIKLRGSQEGTLEFQCLQDSIEDHGMRVPLEVRKVKRSYELVDGMQRYTAAKNLLMEEVPVIIVELEDSEVIFEQIRCNEHRIATRPSEIREALLHILRQDTGLTVPELAGKLNQPTLWLKNHMELTRITDPILIYKVDTGAIPLTAAFYIGKLPPGEQDHYASIAEAQPVSESVPIIRARVKELKESAQKCHEPVTEFKPLPIIKNRKQLISALDNPESIAIVIRSDDKSEIIKEVLQWVFNLDSEGVLEQRKKFEKLSK